MNNEQTIEERLEEALNLSNKIKQGISEVADEIADQKLDSDKATALRDLLQSTKELENELNRLESNLDDQESNIQEFDDYDDAKSFFYGNWRELAHEEPVIKIEGNLYKINDWRDTIDSYGYDHGLSEYISWGLEDMVERELLLKVKQ